MCTHCNDSQKNAQADAAMCSHCGRIDQPMYDVNGVLMCKDCADARAYLCDNCGAYHLTRNYVTVRLGSGRLDEQSWCDDCAAEAVACDCCGFLFAADVIQNDKTWEGYTVTLCPDCLEYNYYRCEFCGRIVESCDVHIDVYGDIFCPNCIDEQVDGLLEYGPTYAHTMLQTSDDLLAGYGLFLGCELEFATYDVRDLVDGAHGTFGDLVECKKDCSVSGAELAFQPMSPSYIFDTGFSDKIQRLARECGAFADSSCGFHIHINRNFFGCHDAVYAIVALMGAHPIEWLAFSGRSSRSMREWANIVVPDGREGFEMHRRSRYEAVNLTNHDTIEIRLWAGQNDSRMIDAMIQATVGLALVVRANIERWSENDSFDEIMWQSWDELAREICIRLDTFGLPCEAFRERAQFYAVANTAA